MVKLAILLGVPALAAAKLLECANLPGVTTGVSGCSGSDTDTTCRAELRIECSSMRNFHFFSESGIPCGSSMAESCHPEPNISFPHPVFPPPALDALAEAVSERLVRGRNNTDVSSVLDGAMSELYLPQAMELNVTFLSEGACERNSMGFTTFPEDDANVPRGNPRHIGFPERRALLEDVLEFSVIFPNTDFEFCQCRDPGTPDSYDDFCTESLPELRRGTTLRLLPDFRRRGTEDFLFDAGTFVSFFVLPDGFETGFSVGEVYDTPMEQTLFSTPELNDPTLASLDGEADKRQHAIVFRGLDAISVDAGGGITEMYDFTDEIFFCFEDRRRRDPPRGKPASESDFEDLCIFVSHSAFIPGFQPTAMPSAPPTGGLCAQGILSECGNVCCGDSCGTCGGCNCALAPGGADRCCPQSILFNGIFCSISSDVGCIVDIDLMCDEPGTGCVF